MRGFRWFGLLMLGLLFCSLGCLAVASDAQLTGIGVFSGQIISYLHKMPGILLLLLGIAGIMCIAAAVHKTIILKKKMTSQDAAAGQAADESQLKLGPKIVAIGGGTGIPVLLRGLKRYTDNLTAVITVTDDGGSSGSLRDALGMPPPGDIRNCLVALATAEPLMKRLFQYRFNKVKGLEGHSFGNLFIAAMTEITGDFERAVKESSKVLAVQGRVLPSTLENVTLCAEMADGQYLHGECQIVHNGAKINRIMLEPANPQPLPEVISAIINADVVVIGPGSLYTSIMPNLLIPELARALQQTKAVRIYVCNIMTQHGETDDYDAVQHIKAVHNHVGKVVDCVVLNSKRITGKTKEKYREQESYPVKNDRREIEKLGLRVIESELISDEDLLRHDPDKLARVIMRICKRYRWISGQSGTIRINAVFNDLRDQWKRNHKQVE